MRAKMQRTWMTLATLGLIGGALAGAALAADSDEVLLTAVQGDASSASQVLAPRVPLADGEPIETGSGGSLAVLVDRNAVVEMCDNSRVSFTAKAGTRVVRVDAGTVRLVVEPREPGQRMEIHTPTAIATILGTVVYVTVDPVSGATTVASAEHSVNIRGNGDGADPKGTTIESNEQLTIGAAGRQESEKRALEQMELETLQACLADFHGLALATDRIPPMGRAAERVARSDVATESIHVSAEPPSGPARTTASIPG